MKRIYVKAFTLLLALVMVTGLIPTAVFADDTAAPTVDVVAGAAGIGEGEQGQPAENQQQGAGGQEQAGGN